MRPHDQPGVLGAAWPWVSGTCSNQVLHLDTQILGYVDPYGTQGNYSLLFSPSPLGSIQHSAVLLSLSHGSHHSDLGVSLPKDTWATYIFCC